VAGTTNSKRSILDRARELLGEGAIAEGALHQHAPGIYRVRVVEAGREYRLLLRQAEVPAGGDCSCGSSDCRHMAAARLALAEPALLERLRQQPALPVQPADDLPQTISIHYLLQPLSGHGATICTATRLDGETQMRDYEPNWLLVGRLPSFVTPLDQELIRDLEQGVASSRKGGCYPIDGAGGSEMLSRLLESGRLWLAPGSVRLRAGCGELPLVEWQVDEFGRQRLSWGGGRLVRLGDWWLIAGDGSCYRLSLTLQQADALADLVASEQIEIESLADYLAACEALAGVVPPLVPLRRQRPRKVSIVPILSISREEQCEVILLLDRQPFHPGQPLLRRKGNRLLDYRSLIDQEVLIEQPLSAAGLKRVGEDGWSLDSGISAYDWLLTRAGALLATGWQLRLDGQPASIIERWCWQIDIGEQEPSGTIGLVIELDGDQRLGLGDLARACHAWQEDRINYPGLDHLLLELDGGGWVLVAEEQLRLIDALLPELMLVSQSTAMAGDFSISRAAALRFAALSQQSLPNGWQIVWPGIDAAQLLQSLLEEQKERAGEAPDQLLRHYQQRGVAWLQRLYHERLGAILADEMGLGKTLQLLYHIALCRRQGGPPSLVVAPTSLLGNWLSEANRFQPELQVVIYHGSDRRGLLERLGQIDMVVTSYGLARIDPELSSRHWQLLILDEAQAIRNRRSRVRQQLQQFQAEQCIAVSGTPFENNLGELWSLFDFVLQGLLGPFKQFQSNIAEPIAAGNQRIRDHLVERISPFLLRRHKLQVASELPPRTELLEPVVLSVAEQAIYERIRSTSFERISQAISEKGLASSQMTVLEGLLRLRQVCCDSSLLPESLLDGPPPPSSKVEQLVERIKEAIGEGHQILVFSQFVKLLQRITSRLDLSGIEYELLTGSTTNRDARIARFQGGEVPVFLISLRAGGAGLNLTAADMVIHVDPWWNPAVERQASDRAHRIGQQRPVFVHHMICNGTIEERVRQLQLQKQALFDALFAEEIERIPELDEAAIAWLFAPLQPGWCDGEPNGDGEDGGS
jgi:superfamily II DNA or RNA helicase